MDIATLGIEVKSDGTLTAKERLDRLTASSVKAESVTGSLARQALATDRATRALQALRLPRPMAQGLWPPPQIRTLLP